MTRHIKRALQIRKLAVTMTTASTTGAKDLEVADSKPLLTFVTGNPKKLEEVRVYFRNKALFSSATFCCMSYELCKINTIHSLTHSLTYDVSVCLSFVLNHPNLCGVVGQSPSLVPRLHPAFQCCTLKSAFQCATLKCQVEPGNEATSTCNGNSMQFWSHMIYCWTV